jgi:hypothetical protein
VSGLLCIFHGEESVAKGHPNNILVKAVDAETSHDLIYDQMNKHLETCKSYLLHLLHPNHLKVD